MKVKNHELAVLHDYYRHQYKSLLERYMDDVPCFDHTAEEHQQSFIEFQSKLFDLKTRMMELVFEKKHRTLI
jgi:hypothetical protein